MTFLMPSSEKVRSILFGLLALLAGTAVNGAEAPYQAGVARVDITPDYPIRLSGFGSRRTESEGVTQRLWAKALALGDPAHGPVVLVTVDNLAIPDYLTRAVAQRLERAAHVDPSRFTITCTHTHTAPMLKDVCPTLFGVPIPSEHLAHINRYTAELEDKIQQVALAAVKDLKAAQLEFGIGKVGFATNRRTKGGPVDPDLPVLIVRALDGSLRAIYTSYACHCVTLADNKISGDWAGYAQEAMERDHPGALALLSVGCGADSNPASGVTGDNVKAATEQGAQIAAQVNHLLRIGLLPLTEAVTTRLERIVLAFAAHPTREEWHEKAKRSDAVGYHARVQLAKLDRGETLATELSYPVQTWSFGNQLALVFLPGEVVVDYSLRLKRELDRSRVWVNGYANDEPCYIPSERILREGGYEGGDAMVYYDRPTRFAPGLEQKIIDAVRGQLPVSYVAPIGTEGTAPRSPMDSRRSIRTQPGLEVELVASEPLIVDPVAIDWGADGKLWVCEMRDYPMGLDNHWKPGGRVKILEDTDGDGHFDRATIFLDNLPFPTGVTAWRKGALICAAPDILYAEDTDGDGRADVIKTLFSGFYTDNYQARVNSLSLGLDNWVYGANGLLGGVIRGAIRGKEVNIRNQDFRLNPDTGDFEPVAGLTQQGRVRDDWDNWFGCDNGTLLRFYPLADRYVRRNPSVAAPEPGVVVPNAPDPNRVFPASITLPRFNDLNQANRVTSACGLGLYRDELLGTEFSDNAFTCEPVHNLVHREVLTRSGLRFTSRRAADEAESEFLASSDNWFRPVQVRTGPDGALWIVDMYRFLIEHPRWIQAERLTQLDVRAGADRGRIYRVFPSGRPLRKVRNLTQLNAEELAEALDSPNGTERDRAHLELLSRPDSASAGPLVQLAQNSPRPAVRAQAWCALQGLNALTPALLQKALRDPDPRVRQQSVRLSEQRLATSPELARDVLSLTNDPDLRVRFQLALSLGEWDDLRAGQALRALAGQGLAELYLRAALLSSATRHCGELLPAVLQLPPDSPGRNETLGKLIATASASNDQNDFEKALLALAPKEGDPVDPSRLNALATLADALDQKQWPATGDLRDALNRVELIRARAGTLALDPSAEEPLRESALHLLKPSEVNTLAALLDSHQPPRLQLAAAEKLGRNGNAAQVLLKGWNQYGPALRERVLGILASRDSSISLLFDALGRGQLSPRDISAATRERLLKLANTQLRQQAESLFLSGNREGRAEVLARYSSAARLPGAASKGAELFDRNCASCHALHGLGHDVGPSLAALHDKEPEYWLKNILDPNAVIEPRFVAYNIETKDGRSLSGVIQAETSTALTLVQGGGAAETILRSAIQEIRASGLSLMPEGLEQNLTPQDLADLIAFAKQGRPPKRATNPDVADGEIARDPKSLALVILDDDRSNAVREAAINANPQFWAELIAEMTRDLTPGTPEEYRRIPWIWRVAIATGRRNDTARIRKTLAIALPQLEAPLRDWQAVVVGGGIINGLSQQNLWPAGRLAEVLADDAALKARWTRALDLASPMADDEKVPAGTRYDALRMLGVESWDKRGAQLIHYLAKGTNEELQMGAISALADMRAPAAARALLDGFVHFSARNRGLVLDALLRDESRAGLLLDGIARGLVNAAELGDSRRKQLIGHPQEAIRQRAARLLQ
jgi:putative membrane-bound dehydrogenase-like protein